MITKGFDFLILLRFYLLCFLMKTAVAIPLKKSGNKENQCFHKGNLLLSGYVFYFEIRRIIGFMLESPAIFSYNLSLEYIIKEG